MGRPMYIRDIHIQNLKLLRNVPLSFVRSDGTLRMWTILIGENATGKTSILYALALAAAGSSQVNTLARPVVAHLRDRRSREPMKIDARFCFSAQTGGSRLFPGLDSPPSALTLHSELTLAEGEANIEASSRYMRTPHDGPDEVLLANGNPLDKARSRNLPLWFVAAYGVSRLLTDPTFTPRLDQPSIDRLTHLFGHPNSLTGVAFADYFSGQPDKTRLFSRVLQRVLFHSSKPLLPGLSGLELRGQGGIRTAGDLLEAARFKQQIGAVEQAIPAIALAHGHQSTIAWIADLVGHIVLESDAELPPEEMTGLVLLDEIDLYLHPTWQVALVGALREIFPKIQFIVTTHSPLVLANARPDEIVALERDGASGDVVRACWTKDADARTMTTADLYQRYFGIRDIFPTFVGQAFRDYLTLAADPFRTEDEERKLMELEIVLNREEIHPNYPVIPRQ